MHLAANLEMITKIAKNSKFGDPKYETYYGLV